MKTTRTVRLLALLILHSAVCLCVQAQGTAITYQGRLADGTSAASGSYDFRFTAFNAGTSGSSVGSAVTTNGVAVSNGLFTATLDFGASVFTGPARWLQIEVKTNGAPSYATLTPRQPLMPAPYAVYAPNAGAAATATTATSATLATTATTANGVAASSVGTAGLADNSVTGAKILDGSVGTADLADNAVTAAKILDGAVGTADLANNAVTSAKVVDASITAADLATDAAGLAKVSGGAMSSSGTSLTLSVDQYLNDKDIHLRNDALHGLGWYGTGKLFAGQNLNGPALYGGDGGALGSVGAVTNIALQWDASRNVTIGAQLRMNTNVIMNDKDLLLRGDANHGVGWFGAGKLFAGVGVDGPVLYGWSGGGLGTLRSGVATNLALTWDASGKVGIGKTNPATALDVTGTVTATSFTGSGEGLTGSLLQAISLHVNEAVGPHTAAQDVWTKVADLATFTKQSGATLEVVFNGRVSIPSYVAGYTGALFALRVGGNPAPTARTAEAECFPSDGKVRVSITGIFTGVGAGSRTVSMWVKPSGGTVLDTTVNPGDWAATVTIKEYK